MSNTQKNFQTFTIRKIDGSFWLSATKILAVLIPFIVQGEVMVVTELRGAKFIH